MAEWGRDEQELVRRCREGSDAAYAALVHLHRPRLFTLAYRLTGDRSTAEDVVQETFLAAFKAIDRFEPKPSLAPWLNTMLVRIAGRAANRQKAKPTTSIDARVGGNEASGPSEAFAEVDPSADPEAAAESAELRRQLAAAISALPFNQRAAVVLRHIVGLDYAEAAQAMDVPLNTFKSHLLRGTRELRQQLTGDLGPPARLAAARNGEHGGVGLEGVGLTGPVEVVSTVGVRERPARR